MDNWRTDSGQQRPRESVAAAVGAGMIVAAIVALSGCQATTDTATSGTATSRVTQTAPSPSETGAAGDGSPTAAPTTTAINAVQDEQREWIRQGGQVFADAPLATFPVSAFEDKGFLGCTDEQLAWLTKYGVAATEGISLNDIGAGEGVAPVRVYELTNLATPGTTVTVRNLRVEGAFAPESPARFTFACVNGGIGGDFAPYWEIATIGDSSPATYVADPNVSTFFDKDQLLAADLDGAPFTANLKPGGTFQLNLILKSPDTSQDFRGRIVVDVVIGDHTYQDVLDNGYLQMAPASLTTVFAIAGFDRLFCLTDEAAYQQAYKDGIAGGSYESLAPYECTPQALADMVAAAQ